LAHPFLPLLSLEEIKIKGKESSKVYRCTICFFASVAGNIEDQIRTIMIISEAKAIMFLRWT
jgi:hypothetical protein